MYFHKPQSNQLVQAEVRMVMLLVHHNMFFNLFDHLTKFITREFKGSPAASNFVCGRTKTAAIINCIGERMKEELISNLQKYPFSVMLDASSDTGLYKKFPVIVRIFDINFGLAKWYK